MASWLVRLTPERAVRVWALAGEIVLCSWARHLTLIVSLSTQVCKWENLTTCGGVTCDGLLSHPGEVEILLAASCYRNRDKRRQLWAKIGWRLHFYPRDAQKSFWLKAYKTLDYLAGCLFTQEKRKIFFFLINWKRAGDLMTIHTSPSLRAKSILTHQLPPTSLPLYPLSSMSSSLAVLSPPFLSSLGWSYTKRTLQKTGKGSSQ